MLPHSQCKTAYSFAERFTGLDMLKIDMANTYGLDKELFADRISWINQHQDNIFDNLDAYSKEANEPLLFRKSVYAMADALAGQPIKHNVFMDATASGYQIMAALSGCKKTAELVNLIDNGKRNDLYTILTNKIVSKVPDSDLFINKTDAQRRKFMKKPIMTHGYNSRSKPREILGEDSEELEAFYLTLQQETPGAEAVRMVINMAWNPNAMFHQWTLPDGHVVKVRVTDQVDTRIEVDELDHMTFAYRFFPNQPSERNTSLTPNVIHSIDAYIAREIIRRCNHPVAHIHDAFTTHPNNMPVVMDLYRELMAEIAESNLLENIIKEITGDPELTIYGGRLDKYSYDLANDIRKAEYPLS